MGRRFFFIAARALWFPEIKKVAGDSKAGVNLTAYEYSPWLWNRERITVVNIHDWKNDADNFEIKLTGRVSWIRFIHSGEDFAVVSLDKERPDSYLDNIIYIVRRSPKAEGPDTLEMQIMEGNILAVAPDESGYFYYTEENIFKSDWDGNTLMETNLPMRLDPPEAPPYFFSNNTKMAFQGTPWRERDGFLFIWDLKKNELKKFDVRKLYPDYPPMSLSVQNDKLYIERQELKITKQLLDD